MCARTLHVFDARVELGVDKQNAHDGMMVRGQLALRLHVEKVVVRVRAPHILVDLRTTHPPAHRTAPHTTVSYSRTYGTHTRVSTASGDTDEDSRTCCNNC